jgi:hypothetical protein
MTTGKISDARTWLNANKIWFETVAASLLSVMAIIVSVGQSCAAAKQTQLLAVQTRIAEAQALPQFEVAMRPKLNDSTAKFDDYNLVVTNRGGMVQDFSATAACFLRLEASGAGLEVLKADVPVNGYFTVSYLGAAGVGELVTMVGNHNNAAVMKLSDDLRALAHSRQVGFAHFAEQIILRLRYRDLLSRSHEDYYEANLVGGGARISDEAGKARLAEWERARRPELASLRADELLARATPSK